MITAQTVKRFVSAASTPRPYRFLHELLHEEGTPPTCRKHRIPKARHKYGSQLWVCPKCFPSEARV